MQRPRSERGASAVEYALLAVAVAAIIVTVVMAIGLLVSGMFDTTCTNLTSEIAGEC
jgi:Flp pilus assembly pilin Flp